MTSETNPAPESGCASALDPFNTSERSRRLAAELNKSCFCITLDRAVMAGAMKTASRDPEFYDAHMVARPHLFSSVPVFLPDSDREAMLAVARAVEETARIPAYRDAVLAWAPGPIRGDFGPIGAMMGYDFHLTDGPPRLIEINTNAGGAFLNAFSARAQKACCAEVEAAKDGALADVFDSAVIAMFESEWRRQRSTGRPQHIAIVDDGPRDQYLYPEFVLAQRLFEANGIDALIADPAELVYADGQLRIGDKSIDLVYNRLVDFALAEPHHAALQQAWLDGATVVTPNPHTHALFADKRNLTLLSDAALLRMVGASEAAINALSTLPHAVLVTSAAAEALWTARKRLFFKPVSGHGGKAVYRGDKLTRTVWANILASDYIAQDLALPGERQIMLDGVAIPRKMDVRL
ncbi:MAG: hypothetical protein SGJ21_16740 [Alphaproteobacteria bacterium]|nr:hypothetical protein [Alphaproteobacteria bacterium]